MSDFPNQNSIPTTFELTADAGIEVSTAAGVDTYGAWTEIDASSAAAIRNIHAQIADIIAIGAARRYTVEFGVGAGSAEIAFARRNFYTSTISQAFDFDFFLQFNKGSRTAIRIANRTSADSNNFKCFENIYEE